MRELGPRSEIFRGRTHSAAEQAADAAGLGAPPVKYVLSANRMSSAGVSMFYGAFDQETAQAEALGADPSSVEALTIARFTPLRVLPLLDLTRAPGVPSVFDEAHRAERPSLSFLNHFICELERPVTRDRSEHIEYAPTQAVCEYLRVRFRLDGDVQLDGIVYGSVRKPGGENIVLFIDDTGTRDPAGYDAAARLKKRIGGTRSHAHSSPRRALSSPAGNESSRRDASDAVSVYSRSRLEGRRCSDERTDRLERQEPRVCRDAVGYMSSARDDLSVTDE